MPPLAWLDAVDGPVRLQGRGFTRGWFTADLRVEEGDYAAIFPIPLNWWCHYLCSMPTAAVYSIKGHKFKAGAYSRCRED